MSLRDSIIRRIQVEGPITVAAYMSDCLTAYYGKQDPLGTDGDFTTAPEISQMFGELIGLSLAQSWLDQGAPTSFTLAELGPGRGTLMSDIWRATARVPGFHAAAQVHLVEMSPALRAVQASRLSDITPHWHDTVADLPDAPLFLVANEFFDALPIRQFQRGTTGWRERQIGFQDGDLSFGLGPEQPQPALTHRLEDTETGDLVEDSPSLAPIVHDVGHRIRAYGGAALIFDYGDWRSLGDTLQAVRAHRSVDPLESPGDVDLTAHVDFEAITIASPCAHTKVTPQGVFLERLGITSRAQKLAQSLTGRTLDSHIAAHRRLTHPEEMGTVFKVVGLYPESSSPPPGLEA